MAEDLEEETADSQRKYELENPRDDMPPEAYDPEDSDGVAEGAEMKDDFMVHSFVFDADFCVKQKSGWNGSP